MVTSLLYLFQYMVTSLLAQTNCRRTTRPLTCLDAYSGGPTGRKALGQRAAVYSGCTVEWQHGGSQEAHPALHLLQGLRGWQRTACVAKKKCPCLILSSNDTDVLFTMALCRPHNDIFNTLETLYVKYIEYSIKPTNLF